MAITFPTVFQSSIATDPAATAAGYLTPTRYNQGVAPAGLGTNQVLYSTGATTLAQSSNLTFDGTHLAVTGGNASAPTLTFGDSGTGFFKGNTSNEIFYASNQAAYILFGRDADDKWLAFRNTWGVAWCSGAPDATAVDTTVSRSSAGVVQIGTTAANNSGTLDATLYKAGGTAGVANFGPAGVTSITVKGGIITAIS